MSINFSNQTTSTIIQEYEYRVQALFKAKAFISSKPATVLETFGSALKAANYKDGNCNSWYVAEMAEKRALSRAVLKLTGFYELGVFGEDESEDFKKK